MWYDRERDYLDVPISRMDRRGIEVSVPQAGRERDKQICLCKLGLRLDPEKLESSHFC